MIKKTTVFILGAGASVPFNYPTGFDLQGEIKQFLKNVPEQENILLPKNSPYQPALWDVLGFSRKKLREFFNDFSHSVTYSIDKFLERRPDRIELGKLLIAHVLRQKEQAHYLHIQLKATNWYAELANRLDLNPDNIDSLKLSFITFNYDRSLEYFLYYLLKNRTTDIKRAQEAFEKIKIVHVYGGFGNLPWEEKGIPYEYHVTPEILERFAKGIKIIGDERDTAELENARQLIDNADHIYFMGFGYDENNLKRLGIPRKPSKRGKFLGTAYHLKHSDAMWVRVYFNEIILAKLDETIMDFLDQYVSYE